MRGVQRRKSFFSRLTITNALILINAVVFFFLYLLVFVFRNEASLKYFALNPELFFQGYLWTIITSMFSHLLFLHLFVNMVSLFFIGNFIERLIGRKRYIWFYLIAGISAGIFFVGLAYLGQFVPYGEQIFGGYSAFAVGASGALFGLGGLLAILIPRLKVLVFFVIPMPLWLAMAILMFGIWIISAFAAWPIGNTAHFGGLVIGVIYGIYLRKKYSRKVRMLNRMFG